MKKRKRKRKRKRMRKEEEERAKINLHSIGDLGVRKSKNKFLKKKN